MIAKDYLGSFVGCESLPLYYLAQPSLLEARLILQWLKFASNRDWERVIIESDCRKAKDIIHDVVDLSSIGSILEDIGELKVDLGM